MLACPAIALIGGRPGPAGALAEAAAPPIELDDAAAWLDASTHAWSRVEEHPGLELLHGMVAERQRPEWLRALRAVVQELDDALLSAPTQGGGGVRYTPGSYF